jgi:error-prone DNA polymerase
MPELPEPKRPRHHDGLSARIAAARPRYAELHCKTNFSFLEGASHADELVQRAAELDYAALAITDRNSLAGVVRAHGAAKQLGLKLLIGAEITPIDGPSLVLLATDRAAYGRLSRLITQGRRSAPKGECRLTCDDLAAYAAGLLACTLDFDPRYRDIFADRCYLLAEQHCGSDDARDLAARVRLARRERVPLVAAGGVRFHHPSRRPLCDVLTAVGAGCTVAEAGA